MQDKLQELTDRLYNEGLSKGKQDGEELLQKAHAEADSIIAQAKAEAERIVAQANKEAEELKTKVTADVKMAATQSIAVTKQEIEKMVVTKTAAERRESQHEQCCLCQRIDYQRGEGLQPTECLSRRFEPHPARNVESRVGAFREKRNRQTI